MATSLVKTIQTEPIPMQQLTAGSTVISSVIDVSTTLAARVFFDVAVLDATFSNPPPPKVQVQASKSATGNDGWFTVKERMSPSLPGASPVTFSAAVLAGDTTCQTGAAIWSFNFVQTCFIWDPTFSLSEWNKISGRSGNVNTMIDPFTNAHPITTTKVARGLRETFAFDCFSITRIRIAVFNNSTTNAINQAPNLYAVRVALITTDTLT